MTQRTERVDELLRQEIGQLLAKEIADPRIGFATITDVETTPDLRHAKVWVSVIGSDAERHAAVAALAHAVPFIRHELGSRLRIKRIPDLHVRLDDTNERGTRVLRLLNEIEAGTPLDEPPADPEALPTPVARLPHEGDAPEPPTAPVAGPERQPGRRRGRPSGAPGSRRGGGSGANRGDRGKPGERRDRGGRR